MASRLLYELVAPALEVTGPPEWRYDDARADLDRLEWLRPEDAPDGDWMLLCPDTGDHLDDMDDIVLEEPVARDLLIAHFQRWLAERGWQIQLALRRGRQSWRLADCLGIPDGGGDRLDGDYPEGTDELHVLVESVLAVATRSMPPVPVP